LISYTPSVSGFRLVQLRGAGVYKQQKNDANEHKSNNNKDFVIHNAE